MLNYHNRKFRPVSNSENGEVDSDTIFTYQQEGNIVSCSYGGNQIIQGHLIGLVDEHGAIDMRYHQVNKKGALMTGICKSTPRYEHGRLRLYEAWQWTSGDLSKGNSTLEEMDGV